MVKVLLANGFSGSHAIVDAARAVLAERNHQVTTLGLIDAGFGQFMSAAERRAYHEPDNLVTPAQRESADLIRTHQAILICGPVIAATIAPCVKSWLERVMVPEVAFTFDKSGRVTGAMPHVRRAGMIVECKTGDRWAHSRRGSTRSALRGIRMMSSRWCRTTYLHLDAGADIDRQVARALTRW